MKFKNIYKKYQVMPMLQHHLVRVAYVGNIIAINTSQIKNPNNIVVACLLHDIGNIVKFNLSAIPEAVKPKGLKFWQKVKESYILKYGKDEVLATYKIVEELKLSLKVKQLICAFGTRNVSETIQTGDLEKMIVNYSDHRVSPFGIVTLHERIEDQHKRILKSLPQDEAVKKIAERIEADNEKYLLETAIFQHCKIKPGDIDNPDINEILGEYLSYSLK